MSDDNEWVQPTNPPPPLFLGFQTFTEKWQLGKTFACIYSITNIINNKRYIGSTNNAKQRWHQHKCELGYNRHHSTHLQNAWNKYGSNSFIFEILEIIDNIDILFETEDNYIQLYESYNEYNGYNLYSIAFGKRNFTPSEETRKKISEKLKGRKIDPEIVAKIAKANTGQKRTKEFREARSGPNHFFYGRTHKEESIQKMKEKLKGLSSGEKNPSAKLTWEFINQIREQYKNEQISIAQLARDFDCGKTTIRNVIYNRTWKDDTYFPPENQYKIQKITSQKLNWEKVRQIREKRKNGAIYRELIEEYKISRNAIKDIINNKSWRKENE